MDGMIGSLADLIGRCRAALLRGYAAKFIAAVLLLGCPGPLLANPIDDAQKIDVRIPAGDVVLAATLYRPAGANGVLPAVVMGHGSGRVTRKANGFWINTALATGLAVLAYDKRGTGESTGKFPEWNVMETPRIFQALADDMVHATRWLATQPGIDANRLGLMGGSQAGWVMPLAASREPMIKFVIAGEGVPVATIIEELHGRYLDATNKEGEGNPGLRQVAGADILALDYQGPPGYDPGPVLEKLDIPVLWIFGLYDGVIPVRQSINRIGELHKIGKRNHALHIFPFGNHNFVNVFTGERYSVSEVSRSWLKEIGIQQ